MRYILVADDHEILRRGVRHLIQEEFPGAEIGEAGTTTDVLARVHEHPWDLILLDILMPGVGIQEALTRIRADYPRIPILLFTGLREIEPVVLAMKAGANGVVHKHRTCDDLINAIRTVASGEIYLPPDVATAMDRATEVLPHLRLSGREIEVFRLIARGRPMKDIATALDLSEKTVGTYLARIRDKTGLGSYVEITRYALHNKVVE